MDLPFKEYLDYHNVKENKAQFINLILSTIFANKEVGKRKENESEHVFGQNIGELIWEQLAKKDINDICNDAGLIV